LLAIAIIPQPNLANAADGKGGSATAFSVMRGPGSDRSDVSEVPDRASVVLRGTRLPNASEPSPGEGVAPNNAFQQGSNNPYQQGQNNTFQQEPLYGSGWDQRYDYRGLSGTYFQVPR
jgi:hypothetical protein